jgi:hypothetical protein
MEINLNTNIDSVTRANNLTTQGREVRPTKQQVSFENSDALNQALSTTPDVRNDEVKRAAFRVLGSVPYPPEETVAKIAQLLAMKLDQNQ